MTDLTTGFAYDDGDVDTNRTQSGPTLSDLIGERYSRRQALRGGASAAALAVFGPTFLAACDDNGGTSANPAPTVTATGSATSISTGNRVTVNATATDDGSVASTAFTQVSGPAVTLSSATGTSTSFIAPAVTSATPVVIRFSATDNSGNTSTVDTTVTVNPAVLSFNAVAKNRNDVVTVPTGYTLTVLGRTGDPLTAATPAYRNDGTDNDFANRFGDHHDALYYYGLNAAGARDDASNTRGLLVTNHENITEQYLHANGPTVVAGARPEVEAVREIELHGVSVAEVTQAANGTWSYVQNSAFNRRITPNTPMAINGPVRGTAFVQTAFSPDGTQGRGTINNCANGYTPWGTNLTCEENWAGYFRRPAAADNPRRSAKEVTALTRYGVTNANGNYGWATVQPANATSTIFRKWDAQATGASATADYRNEPNQYGWVVEIDPYNAASTPRKRTALGRMNHEGAWPGLFVVGRKPAWYMGDDAQNEYLYKFVSNTAWVSADASATDRLAIGDKYLDAGTLYVARFNADGTGTWLPLVFGTAPLTAANATYPFESQADVLTHARLAGDAVGATRMDRPEWTATNPVTGEVYLTLTNNSSRNVNNTDAANPRAYVDPPSTSVSNRNGHIIRLRETGDTTEATTFAWDIYLFGAGSDLNAQNINLSGLTADNDFSSPDGLWFSRASNPAGLARPLLWIQTDDGAFTDQTNNQMLAALPGTVNDGGANTVRTITNTNGTTTTTQATRVGANPGSALKRFLVGPNGCEITGIDSTPDGRSVFVNIQHPGEGGNLTNITSNWPASQSGAAPGTRPRSATIVIQRTDGGIVGL
jgi:uncharacterized protein